MSAPRIDSKVDLLSEESRARAAHNCALAEKLPYRHLTTLILDVVMDDILAVGAIPAGKRSIAPVRGGRFEGERLSGEVLSGGSDWVIVRADGTFSIDVRLALKTSDGALIALSYQGRFLGDRATMAAFRKGEQLDADAYSLQAVVKFECGDERYTWLNELIAVAIGKQTPTGPIYQIYGIGQ